MNKKGFTLVELLAVIVVLSIVMLVVADRVGDAMLKSRGNSLVLQVKSLNREVEKIGAMDNQITTEQINKIVSSGDLSYLGYIKAGTGEFKDDVIVIQAKKGSKFANISFTKDIKDYGKLVSSYDNNNITLGNKTLKNKKAWLREPIIYFETTVPIDGSTVVSGTNEFKTVNPAPDIPENDKGQDGGETPVIPEKKYKVGDEICLNGQEDCFNVIKDNGNSVNILSKYNLSRDGLRQENVKNNVAFSNIDWNKKPDNSYGYWTDDAGNIKSGYGSRYPINVYNSNTPIYKVVDSYVTKLKKMKNILKEDNKSLNGRLIYLSELVELGFPAQGGGCRVPENKVWIKNGQNWWTGTAFNYNAVFTIHSEEYERLGPTYFYSDNSGVRPVITIDKKYL